MILKSLNKERRALLKIKIDGYIEDAILSAMANNIGATAPLFFASQGLVREMAAQSLDRNKAHKILEAAFRTAYPASCSGVTAH